MTTEIFHGDALATGVDSGVDSRPPAAASFRDTYTHHTDEILSMRGVAAYLGLTIHLIVAAGLAAMLIAYLVGN